MDTLLDTPVQLGLAPSSVTPSVTRSETLTAMDVEALEGVDTSGQWYLRSACRGLEASIFYPDPDVTEDVARALAVCAACEVREVCLAHALGRREPTGIWGGTTERERRRVLRRRRSA
ncbi:MAG: WhiB family transcriptional regulator [Acidimicrobiales bacterium]|nr:WhiB family transcriptional regulator [Acidimicrobiales bacterium]